MNLAIKLSFEKPDRMAEFPVTLDCHEPLAALGIWGRRGIRPARYTAVVWHTENRR